MKRSFSTTSIGLLASSTAGLNLSEAMTAINADHSNIEQTGQDVEIDVNFDQTKVKVE